MKLSTAPIATFFIILCAIQHDTAQARIQGRSTKVRAKRLAPAVIAFGDSILDPGNNNVLPTPIKSNFPPYGKDFAMKKPTGRFCNGKIPTDFVASKLGIKDLLPPYLGTNLTNEELLTGVSFASAGSGYDPLTPAIVSVLSMPAQLLLFKEYQGRVRSIIGDKKAAELFSQSIYGVIAGSDDVANTYFTTPLRRSTHNYSAYANLMLKGASSFIEQLIELGARKIAVIGVPPIGCVPAQRTLDGGILRGCAHKHNALALMYNSKLEKDVERMTQAHKSKNVTLIYADIYGFLFDIIVNPKKHGFEISTHGCCGTGLLEAGFLCNPLTQAIAMCSDVNKHVFWDSFHPTEKAYSILAEYIYQKIIPYLDNY